MFVLLIPDSAHPATVTDSKQLLTLTPSGWLSGAAGRADGMDMPVW
jgi:hypothetical protein